MQLDRKYAFDLLCPVHTLTHQSFSMRGHEARHIKPASTFFSALKWCCDTSTSQYLRFATWAHVSHQFVFHVELVVLWSAGFLLTDVFWSTYMETVISSTCDHLMTSMSAWAAPQRWLSDAVADQVWLLCSSFDGSVNTVGRDSCGIVRIIRSMII